MSHDLTAAINDALEWQDFLAYCDRNEIVLAEDDHEVWRSTFSGWRVLESS